MCKTYFGLEKIYKFALKIQGFENFNFLQKNTPQPQIRKKGHRGVEISADLKISEMSRLGPRKYF